MILSGDLPSHPTFPRQPHHRLTARRARFVPDHGWQAAALLAVAIISAPFPASGCDNGAACGVGINGFFMPLITSSMVAGRSPVAAAGPPVTMPDSILPAEPVVIRPPPRPAAADKTASSVPAHRIELAQWLVPGSIAEGGEATLTVHVDDVSIRPTAGGAKPDRPDAGLSPLRQVQGASGDWLARHVVVLPHFLSWPLGTWQQPVAMQMACGSCGKDGGVAHFSGTATFEMTLDRFAEGWIEDIDLSSADGLRASGAISFWDEQPSRHLAVDHEVVMTLDIGGVKGELGGSLATWSGQDRRIAGMFVATQIGDSAGFGGIAGQFRGEPCAPVCGVEN